MAKLPIAAAIEQLQMKLEERARDHMVALFKKVIMRTPVYTGRTRANWNVSQGSPNYSFGFSTQLSRAMAQVAKIRKMPLGAKIYLANGAPHIRLLEYGGYPEHPEQFTGRTVDGFSSQAPQGMVRISVAEFGSPISAGDIQI